MRSCGRWSGGSRSTATTSTSCSGSRLHHSPGAVVTPAIQPHRPAVFGKIVEAVITRLVGALMLEASDEWAVTRRTMSLEALARVVQTDPVSLPITAARSARASPKAGAPKPPHRALPPPSSAASWAPPRARRSAGPSAEAPPREGRARSPPRRWSCRRCAPDPPPRARTPRRPKVREAKLPPSPLPRRLCPVASDPSSHTPSRSADPARSLQPDRAGLMRASSAVCSRSQRRCTRNARMRAGLGRAGSNFTASHAERGWPSGTTSSARRRSRVSTGIAAATCR